MTDLLIGIVGTLISIGIVALIRGQNTIKNDASAGRKVLHDKLNELTKEFKTTNDKVIQLETFHKTNHPGQL